MTGHLFVVNGDLTKIACDAILIPTDEVFHITPAWENFLSAKSIPKSWGNAAVVRLRSTAKEPHIWLGNAGQIGNDSDFTAFEHIINEFVDKAVSALRKRRNANQIYAWPKCRLAINIIGIGQGGASNRKGELVHGLMLALDQIAEEHDVDIILVAYGDKHYSACQRARRQVICDRPLREVWRFDEEANPHLESCAHRLAQAAIGSKLVLFVGAGVSIGAGLPSWGDLLQRVAQCGGVDAKIVKRLQDKDYRDQATLLERWLGSDDGLKKRVATELTTPDRYSLQHGLLASLPSKEAVTTNFDQLFETAAALGGASLPFSQPIRQTPMADGY